MTKTSDLDARFIKQDYRLVDLTLEFKSSFIGIDKYVSTLIESWTAPSFTKEAFICSIIGCLASTGFFMYMQGYNFLRSGLSFVLSLCFVWILFFLIRYLQRYLFLKKYTDKIEAVLKNKAKPTKAQTDRMKLVSPWFKPIGLLSSDVPGKEGLIIVVLSPLRPRLMFARDISSKIE